MPPLKYAYASFSINSSHLCLSEAAAPALACAAAFCIPPPPGGGDQQALMQELIKSAQRPVSAGKVRRKKANEGKRVPPRDKSKGFASVKTR